MSVIARYFHPAEESFFLFGPRGAGKTTLMKLLFPEAIWINFLNPKTERLFLSRPELLYDYLEANKKQKIVVIDEVQKVPKILGVVHDLVEKKEGWQFILTGSNARKIKKVGADLLGGRALDCRMHPFMVSELADNNLDLTEILMYGLIPFIYDATNKETALQSYISLYLKEEIQMEGLTRNIEDFSRFLEAISFSHASILNVSNVARACGVKRTTVESYVHILEDLLLAYQLPVFSRRAKRELINSNKIYLFDSGVYHALRPRGFIDQPEEIDGAALEGLVLQNLRAWRDYSSEKPQLSFWRTRSGVEVDFVVYSEHQFVALEVKNTQNINLKDTKSLKAFLIDYPMASAAVLYRGRDRIMYNGILCVPVDEFLKNLIPNKSIMTTLELI